MKVALVHDYIKEYGGAERVLESLHALFPDAPVYTSLYAPEFLGPHRERFSTWDIRSSWAQKIPFKHKFMSPLRLISPLLFRSFDFSGYDIIISSATGAYFPNMLDKKKAKLFSYCHTPPRYLYGYATAREWKKNKVVGIIGMIMNHFLRMVDIKAAQNVDQYIANSEEVARRIKKFYRKDAVVIYPSVTQIKSIKKNVKREYYITGGRLARAKHNEIPLNACLSLGLPLKIFGKGFAGYEDELRLLIQDNKSRNKKRIEFVGEVTDEEKCELMSGAKALLYASEDEDFGIIPVEAMSLGTPVIAYRSGGVVETVVEEKTGLFYDDLSVEAMKDAIRKFQRMTLKEKDCIAQAKKFSKDEFSKKIKTIVSKNTLP